MKNINFKLAGLSVITALAVAFLQTACMAEAIKCDMQNLGKNCTQFIKSKEYTKALPYIDACISEHPDNAALYNNRGNIYKEMGNYNAAILDYQKAIRLNPSFTSPYNGLAIVYLKTSQYDNGLEVLNKLKEISPNNIEGAINRASIESMMNDYNAAIQDYNIVLKDKRNSIFYRERAYAYLASSKPEQAISDYENYFKAGHSSAEAYKFMGIAYQTIGNNDKAMECYRKAAELYKAENNLEEYNSLMRIFRVY